MMSTFINFQEWLNGLYVREGWSGYHTFTDSNFLLEEMGEIAEIVEQVSALQNFDTKDPINLHYLNEFKIKAKEEIGDVVSALTAIMNRFDININDVIKTVSLKHADVDRFGKDLNLLTSTVKLTSSLGKLAREIRRKEIGRHAHKEKINDEDVIHNMIVEIANAISLLYAIANKFEIPMKDVLSYHRAKMNGKYNG